MKKTILLSISVLALLISPCVIPASYSNQDHSNAEKAMLASIALKQALDLGVPNKKTIIGPLLEGDFTKLESLLLELESNYEKDAAYESIYTKAYFIFTPKNGKLTPQLNKWVETTKSYIAYGARGQFKYEEGVEFRGAKYISETKKENITKMHELYSQAKIDLLAAIKIKPDFIPAYSSLISIAMYSGDSDMAKKYYDDAIKFSPKSYYARIDYMMTLQPRWGGSYKELYEFTKKEAANYSSSVPRLWSLLGEVDAEKGRSHYLSKNYIAAINSYNKALQYGDRTSWLKLLAWCHLKLFQYDEAVPLLEKVLYYKMDDDKTKKVLKKIALYSSRKDGDKTYKLISYRELF